MEGNFRIIQTEHREFRIEKEYVRVEHTGRWPFRKRVAISKWAEVDKKGNFINFHLSNIIQETLFFYEFDSALSYLEKLQKYPMVVYPDNESKNNIPGHRNPPPPPERFIYQAEEECHFPTTKCSKIPSPSLEECSTITGKPKIDPEKVIKGEPVAVREGRVIPSTLPEQRSVLDEGTDDLFSKYYNVIMFTPIIILIVSLITATLITIFTL